MVVEPVQCSAGQVFGDMFSPFSPWDVHVLVDPLDRVQESDNVYSAERARAAVDCNLAWSMAFLNSWDQTLAISSVLALTKLRVRTASSSEVRTACESTRPGLRRLQLWHVTIRCRRQASRSISSGSPCQIYSQVVVADLLQVNFHRVPSVIPSILVQIVVGFHSNNLLFRLVALDQLPSSSSFFRHRVLKTKNRTCLSNHVMFHVQSMHCNYAELTLLLISQIKRLVSVI